MQKSPAWSEMLTVLTSAVALATFALLTMPWSGYNLPVAMLLVLPFTLYQLKHSIKHSKINAEDQKIFFLLFSFFLFFAIKICILNESSRLYDNASRYFIFSFIFLILIQYPPKKEYVFSGVFLGGVLSGVFAVFEKLATGTARVGEHINPIQFGAFSMLLCLLSFVLMNDFFIKYARYKNIKMLCVSGLFFAAGTLGLLASLLSGSRGGWLTAPVFLFVAYRQYSDYKKITVKIKLILLSVFLGIGLAVLSVPKLNVAQRVGEAKDNIAGYFLKNEIATSAGARLEMWRIAMELGSEKPLLGWGHKGYQSEIKSRVDAQQTNAILLEFNEPHNQFLDAFAKHGLIGLGLVFALYYFPFKTFFHRYTHAISNESEQKLFALMGMVSMLAFFDFSLTHSFINKNGGVMLFLFCLTLFWVKSTQRSPVLPAEAFKN